MGSTYLAPACKPWLRFHRDTWRVNEFLREAREHFASRLKAWVRFRPRMLFLFFVFFQKMKRKLSPPPPDKQNTPGILYRNTNNISTCTEDVQYIYIGVPDYSSSSLFVFFSKNEEEAIPPGGKGSYPPPPDKQNTPGILYRNTNTTGIVLKKMTRKLSPPPDKQNTPGILYRNTNTTGKKIK